MSITRRSLLAGAAAVPVAAALPARASELDQYRFTTWRNIGAEAQQWGNKIAIHGNIPSWYLEWVRAMDEQREIDLAETLFAHSHD